MPESYGGFARVEYLAILPAIIYGFIVAEFFMGWGWMLRFRQRIRFDLVHLTWSILLFLLAILMWWGTWSNYEKIGQSIYYYYYALMLPLTLFLIVVFVFPRRDSSENVDLGEYFEEQAPFICLLFGLLFSIQILDVVVFYDDYFFTIKTAVKFGAASLAFSGYFFRTLFYRRFITIFFATGIITFTAMPN